jgi:hypothetical protein
VSAGVGVPVDAEVQSVIPVEPSGAVSTPKIAPPPQRWQLSVPHPEEAATLASAARLPLVVAELLLARGISTEQAAYNFLNTEIGQLHDPFLMLGMAAAVDRLELAITRCETILLYGDYDVDGTTAVVLLKTAIEMLAGSSGCTVRFHVPHRLREGYGIQSAVLEAAAADGVGLVISVDTGMRAFAEAKLARQLGLDLIVTDHHLPDAGDEIPAALAILNPNQPGCTYPEKSLCGAAIAFKLAVAVLQRRDAARTREKTIPSFLKMVALATVADAVPLRGENRVLAALGIRELHRPVGLGLRALFQAAGVDPAAKQLTSFDLGFRLTPRINAAGRMDIAAEVVELFTTRDAARAHELAEKLERLNLERREAEAEVLHQVEARLATDAGLAQNKMLVMVGDGWHHRHSCFAGRGSHRQTGHRSQRRRWRGVRFWTLHRWLPPARSNRNLRRSLHTIRRARIRHRFCHAGRESARDAAAALQFCRAEAGWAGGGAGAAHPRRAATGARHFGARRLAAQAGAVWAWKPGACIPGSEYAPDSSGSVDEGKAYPAGAAPRYAPSDLQRNNRVDSGESGRLEPGATCSRSPTGARQRSRSGVSHPRERPSAIRWPSDRDRRDRIDFTAIDRQPPYRPV